MCASGRHRVRGAKTSENMGGDCKLGSSKISSTSIHRETKTTKTNTSTILCPPCHCFCAKSQRFQVNNHGSPLLIRANSWSFYAWCSKAFLFGSGRFFISYTPCTKLPNFFLSSNCTRKRPILAENRLR